MSRCIDPVLDMLSAYVLRSNLGKHNRDMHELGTTTEPTNFNYSQLLDFYEVAMSLVEDYISYTEKRPTFKRTFEEKKKAIKEHIAILDFHLAWSILSKENIGINKQEFTEMNIQTRNQQLIDSLEQKAESHSGLYNQRNEVIKLCIDQNILPEDYR